MDFRAGASFLYVDSNKNIKPMGIRNKVTNVKYKITNDEVEILIEDFVKILKINDKVTLMTKGIEGLFQPVAKKEPSHAKAIASSIVWFPCCFPCSIALWYKLYKKRNEPNLKGTDGRLYNFYVPVSPRQLNLISKT